MDDPRNSHGWILTAVTVYKLQFGSKSAIVLSRVTLQFNEWPWKTIGHLFCTMSRYVHHFKAISEIDFELQSTNSQFGLKSANFCPEWPRNLTDDLEKNMVPHLCCLKICASSKATGEFKLELQSGNAQFASEGTIDFFSCVTLIFGGWPSKTIGHLFYATLSFVRHSCYRWI